MKSKTRAGSAKLLIETIDGAGKKVHLAMLLEDFELEWETEIHDFCSDGEPFVRSVAGDTHVKLEGKFIKAQYVTYDDIPIKRDVPQLPAAVKEIERC